MIALVFGGISFFAWIKVSGRVILPRIVSNLFIMWNFHPQIIESISTLEENQILTLLNGMKKDLFRIAKVDSAGFGMGIDSSVEKTIFGRPFQEYALTSQSTALIKSDSDLLRALIPTQKFYVPINWGSGNGTFATMQRSKDGWKFIGIGGTNTLITLGKALLMCNVNSEVLWNTKQNNLKKFYFVNAFEESTDLLLVDGPNLSGVSLTAILRGGSGAVTPAMSLVRSVFELP